MVINNVTIYNITTNNSSNILFSKLSGKSQGSRSLSSCLHPSWILTLWWQNGDVSIYLLQFVCETMWFNEITMSKHIIICVLYQTITFAWCIEWLATNPVPEGRQATTTWDLQSGMLWWKRTFHLQLSQYMRSCRQTTVWFAKISWWHAQTF